MEMPRSGLAGAVTCTPSACSCSTTSFQPEASAKAPCTKTTVRGAAALLVSSDIAAPCVSLPCVWPDCSFAQPTMPSWAATIVMVGCTIGITFKGNGRHGDDRTFGKPLFQIVIFRFAFSQAEPPAVIMDHDADVIRVVEGRCAAIERSIIEVPLRRSGLPNELGKVVAVCVVASPAAFRGEIILVPPFELSLGWQRYLVGF